MKKSKFSNSQVKEALKRVESGLSVPDLCRGLCISTAAFYKRQTLSNGPALPVEESLRASGLAPNRNGGNQGFLKKAA